MSLYQVHLIKGSATSTDTANNMLDLGWVIVETGMDPHGWPTFLMGWNDPHNNPPADGRSDV